MVHCLSLTCVAKSAPTFSNYLELLNMVHCLSLTCVAKSAQMFSNYLELLNMVHCLSLTCVAKSTQMFSNYLELLNMVHCLSLEPGVLWCFTRFQIFPYQKLRDEPSYNGEYLDR